jgi:hypothetical protein
MNPFKRRVTEVVQGTLARTNEDSPPLLEGIVKVDRGHFVYDVAVRNRLLEGVHCILPFDGIYAEMVGQVVWVWLGTEPLIVGIKYPRNGGIYEGLSQLRQYHNLVI